MVLAQDCSLISAWSQHKLTAPRTTLSERSQAAITDYDLRISTAGKIFQSYMNGSLTPQFIQNCIPKTDREQWLSSISQVFLKSSLVKLNSSKIKKLSELMQTVKAMSDAQGTTFFRATPHFPDDHSIESRNRAGVYRGSPSLFMNIDLIAPGEWLYLMAHELAHYTDPVLKSASEIWNQTETAKSIFELGKRHASLSTLSADEKKMLRNYLMAGLDRGLLAEYRAWIICFSIYEAGIKESLWGQIPWMQQILLLKQSRQSWEAFTFGFLDKTFTDPEFSGLFSIKIVQEQYFELRQELRSKYLAQ